MRLASTWPTHQAKACSRIRSARTSRRLKGSFLESSSPTMRRRGLRITAAANTGPKSEPRPASSRPAMRCQPLCRAVRSNREEQSRRIGADSSTASAETTRALRREDIEMCLTGSALRDRLCDSFNRPCSATYACRFAFELAQIIELGAANAARLQNFDRADHRRIHGKDSFDADANTDAPDCKSCPCCFAALADHNAFKRLQALFFAFRFLQPNVHTHGITGAERGDILASLVLTDLLNYATHILIHPGRPATVGPAPQKSRKL